MSTQVPQYPFDPTGREETNLVRETQAIQSRGMFDHYYIVPRSGPFYAESVKLRLYPPGTNVNNPLAGIELVEGEHYNFGYHFAHASHTIGLPVYGAISFYDRALQGQLRMEYQSLGGSWVLDHRAYAELLANVAYNPRIATWEQLVELPFQFPVVNHDFSIDDFVGMSDVNETLGDIERAINQSNEGGLRQHVENRENPHGTTKAHVGLGLVDNFPTAALAEATNGTLNTRFMTPLRTRQAIEAIAIAALVAHIDDKGNPHGVTKNQVGLGSVQNYAVAGQGEAEAGASNARYMTPVRTREAILAIVKNDFDDHVDNTSNPHQVTKAQVGLGNVPNIGIATDAAAINGNADDGIITPRLLSLVINETIGDGVASHVRDDQNPHGTTKAQVGLGRVDNFATASQAEAEEAIANDRFMTPLATRQTINALVGDQSNSHVNDRDNPHRVTAAQTGAYSIEEIDLLLIGKLGTDDMAADAERLFGMDMDELEGWIATLQAGDTVAFEGMTYQQVKDDILTGTADNSNKLDGMTYQQLVDNLSMVVDGGSIQFSIPELQEVEDDLGDFVEPGEHWIYLGKTSPTQPSMQSDVTFMVTGGRDDAAMADYKQSTAIIEISTVRDTHDGQGPLVMVVKSAMKKMLTPIDVPYSIGYRAIGTELNSELELWLKITGCHNEFTFTELTNRRFTVGNFTRYTELSQLTTTEPAGIEYCDEISDGSAEIVELIAFSERTDNPHETTKAQVGLGNVENFGVATNQDAVDGVSEILYMTPASTTAKVDDAVEALCTELIDVMDNALANYFA